MAPVLGWTGYYIGGNVGYGWGDQAVNFSGTGLIGALMANGVVASSLARNPSGPIGGIQAGYNWQTGAFVLGVETDIQAADIVSGDTFTSVVGTTTWFTTARQQLNFLGTVRGRLGYTITPALLLYGTGGFAYGGAEVTSSVTSTTGPNPPNCSSFCNGVTSSPRLTGWTAGGGLEYMVAPNWTMKLEYLHYDLGSIAQTYGDQIGRFPTTFVSTSTAFKGDIARIGANYKF